MTFLQLFSLVGPNGFTAPRSSRKHLHQQWLAPAKYNVLAIQGLTSETRETNHQTVTTPLIAWSIIPMVNKIQQVHFWMSHLSLELVQVSTSNL